MGDWLRLLYDGWPALVLCVILGIGGALLYSAGEESTYEATSTLVVSPVRGFLDPDNADQLPALAETVGDLSKTAPVLHQTGVRYAAAASSAETSEERRRSASDSWVESHVSTVRDASTAILLVSATAPTQVEATDLADAAGHALKSVVNKTTGSGPNVPGGLNVTGFAVKSDGKISPSPSRNLFIGLNAGILIGLLAAFLLGKARCRLWDPEDIAAELRVPTLASVRRRRKGGLLVGPEFGSLPDLLAEHSKTQESSTILTTGITSNGRIVAVSELLVSALKADGSNTMMLDLQAPEVQRNLGDEASWTESEAPTGEQLASVTPGGPAGGAGEPIGGGTTPLPEAPLASRAEGSSHPFLVIAGPHLGTGPTGLSDISRQTEHVVLVIERGVSARKLRQVREAGPAFQRQILGAIVIE